MIIIILCRAHKLHPKNPGQNGCILNRVSLTINNMLVIKHYDGIKNQISFESNQKSLYGQ